MTQLLLVEGTCGAGKTTFARALARRDPRVRVFEQRETYAPVAPHEDAGTLDSALHEEILTSIVRSIATALEAGRPLQSTRSM